MEKIAHREIAMLKKLKHPNIIQHIMDFKEDGNIYIVLELLSENILTLLGQYPKGLGKTKTKIYMKQIISALRHMHSLGVIYRGIEIYKASLSRFCS